MSATTTRDPALGAMKLPRSLRVLGYALAILTAGPEIIGWIRRGDSQHGPYWLACYAAFLVAFHAGASSRDRWSGAALAVQEAAVLGMAFAAPCQFAALALVVLALQEALFLSPASLAAAVAAQTALVSVVVMRGCGGWESLSWLLAVLGFQAAASVAVLLARREGDAKEALARANAELRAARALLAEAARADERGRIARELHDALGHSLTALSLQLEVARNAGVDEAPAHVAKAQGLARDALSGVREAVSAMRSLPETDVTRALRELCDDVPGLTVHLDVQDSLVVECGRSAHCIVRCVQEIVTNTLRHAHAKHLWIRVERSSSGIALEARDDGVGTKDVLAGNGLAGMRARLDEVGGRLAVAATPAFSLRAHIPVESGA